MIQPLSKIFSVGEFTIERELNTISHNGQRQIVEPKVMALLYYLSCHVNEVISREKLMEDVWQSQVSEGAVNRVVGLLRKALSDNAESPRYIQTIAKKGYRLIAEVKNIAGADINKNENKIISAKYSSSTNSQLLKLASKKTALLSFFFILILLLINWKNLTPPTNMSFEITNPKFEQLTSEQGFEYDASLSKDALWLVYRHRKNVNKPYHLYLKKRDRQQRIQLTDSEFNDRSPAISHDKSKIIFFRKGNNSCHLNLLTLDKNSQPLEVEELYQCGAVEHYSNVVWAPDDRSVYFTDRINSSMPYQIYQLHLSTLKVDEITRREDNYYGDNELALSPSGEQLLFFRNKYWGNNQVFVKNLLTKELRKITELGFLSWTPSWTPDEKSIIFSDNRSGGKLKLLNVATGDIQTLYQSSQSINSPYLSASGKHIVYSVKTADVDLWQSNITQNAAEELLITPSIKLAVNSSRIDSQPVYSSDALSLLFLSNRNGELQLWLEKEDGVLPIESLPENNKIDTYAWHPDGIQALIATSDKQVYLINTQTQKVELIKLNGQSAAFPIFSSDGATLYFTSDKSGDWQIWAYNFQAQSTVQISQKGGYQVKVNDVDETLYFTKYRQQGIWLLNLKTGKERQIVDNVSRSSNFKVCSNSVYYLLETDGIELWQMNLKSTKTQLIMTSALDSNFKFDLVNDCQKLIFSIMENIESDILMLTF
ncbi:MAG: winged helix-turn-helix domain-containing protein [Colwellia sp.]|nr:winged helix-turn-helix domain-containing protein [Colwellia sp.]